jgi:hypothetical protein
MGLATTKFGGPYLTAPVAALVWAATSGLVIALHPSLPTGLALAKARMRAKIDVHAPARCVPREVERA